MSDRASFWGPWLVGYTFGMAVVNLFYVLAAL